MSRHLHNDPEQSISANEGWQGMQLLLDKHLPVTPAPVKRRPFLFYFAAASLVGLLMLSYLHLQQDIRKKTTLSGEQNTVGIFSGEGNHKAVNSLPDMPFSPTKISPAVFDDGRAKIQQARIRYMAGRRIKNVYSTLPADLAAQMAGDDYAGDKIDPVEKIAQAKHFAAIKNMELIAGKGYTLPVGLQRYNGNPEIKPGGDAAVKADKKRRKGSWETGIGIGSNAVLDNDANLRPFPVGEVKYNFSPKVYVSAGVTAFSPVNSHSRSINKTVYVNDTASNLRLYNEVVNYTRFEYADIPVMAGLRINKRFAIQAGAQASILIGQKKRHNVDGYDFQSNPTVGTDPVTLSPVSSDVFEAKPRKIDGRLIGGISYNLDQVLVNLSYQQAFQASVKGSHVSSSKNKLVSIQVLYRLKK